MTETEPDSSVETVRHTVRETVIQIIDSDRNREPDSSVETGRDTHSHRGGQRDSNRDSLEPVMQEQYIEVRKQTQ